MKGKILLIAVSLLSLGLSMWLVLWVAEVYFFDKFFYDKSIVHGYWASGKNLKVSDFGERAKDITKLIEFASSYKVGNSPLPTVLGAENDGVFKIAVFGDSYVWGQGLRDKDRFARLLQEKLNEVRTTRVLSLALSGDSILENYIKFKLTLEAYPQIDLFIFGLVDNDLLFNSPERYSPTLYKDILGDCRDRPLLFDTSPRNLPKGTDVGRTYQVLKEKSYSNEYGNKCVFKKIIRLLPRFNAIYFYYGSLFSEKDKMEKLLEPLRENRLTIISADDNLRQKVSEKDQKKLYVSKEDLHPSALANRIFAEVLFQEITTNIQWGFNPNQEYNPQ